LYVTELGCAGGRPPDGRNVSTTVTQTDTEVAVLVVIEPVEDGATCPTNPAEPLAIPLGRPLGDRRIRDQSTGTFVELPLSG
jgi:hypothetical protein